MRKKKLKRTVKLIFLLVILMGLGIGIAYYYKNYYNKSDNKTSNNTNEKEVIKTKDSDVEKSIFSKYYYDAIKVVDKMSLEEKVGQLFLVRYNKNDVEYLSNFYPGGYLLFAKDFEKHDKTSIKSEIDKVQSLNKYPLIIAVDEEGGFVTRVSRFTNFRSEKFQSPKYYYSNGGYELLESIENEKATLLKSIGINLNLAPVADIATNENAFIYSRAFGADEIKTSEFIKNMVTYANNNKINSCLKHFPGYGNNIDTHTDTAIDNRNYEEFKTKDFLPFKAGIDAKVPSILVSHNIVTCMDKDYPASLSKKVINELRNTLGFTGIIITDDLDMSAVGKYTENKEAATLAVNAGNDMLITEKFISLKNEILENVKNNVISEDTINKAVIRIIAWKYYSGLFN